MISERNRSGVCIGRETKKDKYEHFPSLNQKNSFLTESSCVAKGGATKENQIRNDFYPTKTREVNKQRDGFLAVHYNYKIARTKHFPRPACPS